MQWGIRVKEVINYPLYSYFNRMQDNFSLGPRFQSILTGAKAGAENRR
jgi:hypothetical protein